MTKRNRKRFTISVSAEIMDSTDSMAKDQGMDRSKAIEKLMWLGHAAIIADECVELVGRLNQEIAEVEREGGSINQDLIDASTEVIDASLLILGHCYSGSLRGVAQILINQVKRATSENEQRWLKGEIESASERVK